MSNAQNKKMIREVSTHDELDRWLESSSGPATIQSLNLDGYANRLSKIPLEGSLFLGCQMSDALAGYLVGHRAVVIPDNWEFEFSPHRASLYRVEELFAGFDPTCGKFGNFHDSFDQRVYREYVDRGRLEAPIDVTLARRLHDHSITDARNEFVDGRKMVAIMGGHDLFRSDPMYRDVAVLARSLTRGGFTLASGGGPGAMEAKHVGAYFAPLEDGSLNAAMQILAERQGVIHEDREYTDQDWLQRAFKVRKAFPLSDDAESAISLAIPTWFYGHEPPAPLATSIAKYFCNSVREDGLLQIANHGVIFAPGNAGTVQEIFQDAAQNYYRTFHHASPMVLLGVDYWTTKRPAWNLVKALADTPGKEHMARNVHLMDSIEEAEAVIREFDPKNEIDL